MQLAIPYSLDANTLGDIDGDLGTQSVWLNDY
jgi:hypothetical protein